jgi:uncharacterized membrane protein
LVGAEVQTDRAHESSNARRADPGTDLVVGWSLLAGLLLSVATMALGLILVEITGARGAGHVVPLDRMLGRVAAGNAPAILDLGILLLFATPFVGVLVALIRFAVGRDLAFMLVSSLLLVLLVVGFAVALR